MFFTLLDIAVVNGRITWTTRSSDFYPVATTEAMA